MKKIKKQIWLLGVIVVILFCVSTWFEYKGMYQITIGVIAIEIILGLLIIKKCKKLSDAKLVFDNSIFTVSSAVISHNGKEQIVEQTLISTFGILIGDQIITWGTNGRDGVMLKEISFEPKLISLIYGIGNNQKQLKISHCVEDKETLSEVIQKFQYETGIEANVIGFEWGEST